MTSSNVKSQDEGKTESEELLCVSQAFKKLPEVDFNSDQVMFFTVLELVMCSGALHTHMDMNVLPLCAGEKMGADAGLVWQGLLRQVQSHTDVVVLVCPQVLDRNRGGLKYGESGHHVYRQQEVKLPFHSICLPVFT